MRRWINDLGMMLLALVLAIVVWIVAAQQENPIEQGEFQDTLSVEVRNQPERTTFLPATFDEQVQLTIRAPQSSWRDLRADKFTAWIDLEGQGSGDYEIPVQATCTDPNVRIIEIKPATVPVRLKKEISRLVPVQIHIYGSAALGYVMKTDETIIEPETVTVTGPAPIVEQVTKATVDLALRDLKETYSASRRPVARQVNDDSVGSFVSVQPPTVQITIPVVQQTGFKEVVVRPRLTGAVASGYWVRSVTVDPITVLLGGDPAVVSRISGFVETMPLDTSGATSDVVERMALDLPEGASTVGVQGVKVTVNVAPQQGSQTILRQLVVRGLSTDLVAKVLPDEVEVTLIGPLPRLNSLTDEDLYVYVELVDKGIGQHRVDLTSLVPEGLQVVSISPATVDVEISTVPPTFTPTPTATLTFTPTSRPTAAPTSTEAISDTLGITATVTPTGTMPAGDNVTSTPLTGTPTPAPTLPSPTPIATQTDG